MRPACRRCGSHPARTPERGASAAAAALELQAGENALAGHAWVLEDSTGVLTFDDVRGAAASRFRVLQPGGQVSGFTSSAYWLRFRVKNAIAWSTFIVDLSDRTPASPAIAELQDEAGRVWRSGASLPFSRAHRGSALDRVPDRAGSRRGPLVLDPAMVDRFARPQSR